MNENSTEAMISHLELADQHFRAADAQSRSALRSLRAAGEELIKARDACGHGDWMKYVRENIKARSYSSIWRYIKLAENWDKIGWRLAKNPEMGIKQALSLISHQYKAANVVDEDALDSTVTKDSTKQAEEQSITKRDVALAVVKEEFRKSLDEYTTPELKYLGENWSLCWNPEIPDAMTIELEEAFDQAEFIVGADFNETKKHPLTAEVDAWRILKPHVRAVIKRSDELTAKQRKQFRKRITGLGSTVPPYYRRRLTHS